MKCLCYPICVENVHLQGEKMASEGRLESGSMAPAKHPLLTGPGASLRVRLDCGRDGNPITGLGPFRFDLTRVAFLKTVSFLWCSYVVEEKTWDRTP